MQFSPPEYVKREPGNRSGQKYKSVPKARLFRRWNAAQENSFSNQATAKSKLGHWWVETGQRQNAQRGLSGI
jgi:hypothetical protein